ncbi:MAG: glutamine--fructose-6-phosphate transaminase (isomerizing) [Firmicutes bacterium]|nr:glutamine--fructose-6-phosphate transaminase (isomerizing) [Bacillota bacterium]
MCGIVGYIGSNEATPFLINGLSHLEYRGYDSAGLAVWNENGINIKKRAGRLSNLEEVLKSEPLSGSLGIGHTRWATHGAPGDANSHPHMSADKKIALVHNGIIENYIELKEALEKKGINFLSETDTEVAVNVIAECFAETKDMHKALMMAAKRFTGAYAFGVICEEEPDTLFAIRNGAPLIVGIGKGENYIASDIPAILANTRDVFVLEDGESAVVRKNSIELFTAEGERFEKKPMRVEWSLDAAEKGGFAHFMLKEIHEQPGILKELLESRLDEDKVRLEDTGLSAENLKKLERIYIVACGTAYHAGLLGKYLLEKIPRIPVFAEVASEFRYRDPIIDENTLVIVVSQSGETTDTLEALRLAKRGGARVLAVVNVLGSSIAREADEAFYILAGPEIAVASTKAYSAQVAAMYLIACHVGLELGSLSAEDFARIRAELLALPEKVEAIIARQTEVFDLAKKYLGAKNVFFIGRGPDHLASMEGSLKLKEIAYLHSEAYAAGELKHGPIAMLEGESLVIAMATGEELFSKTLSNIKEVKARYAKVLAVATEGNTEIEKEADDVFYIPKTEAILRPLLANIPSQLFAYYTALLLGTDIDKPRNLAKSVTVE